MPWNVGLPPAEWYEPGDRHLEAIVNEVVDLDEVALDTETTGLSPVNDMPLFWSLAWAERRLCMPASTMPYFTEAFKDPTKRWIFAGAKFDTHMLANAGIKIAGHLIDTPVMHALLYEEKSHALKAMEKQLLGWQTLDFKELFHPKPGETVGERLLRAQREGEISKLIEYASNDAYGTNKIFGRLREELERERTWSLYPDTFPNMWSIFAKVEVPFTKVLWKCERRGVKIDTEYLKKIQGPIEEEIAKIERKVNHLAGKPLNPNSSKQVSDYFFGNLKMKPRTFTKGGKTGVRAPSVDVKVLEWFSEQEANPQAKQMAELLLRHRDLAKTYGTYVIGMQKHIDRRGRIHTTYNQDVARTGRLSSSKPNLQNVKVPEEDEWQIRKAFIAAERKKLIVGDFDQLEMRLLSCASQEPAMIDTFLKGRDIHMGNAVLLYGPIYEKKHGWTMAYEDLVAAKKTDKKVKAGELSPEALTEHVKLALTARLRTKTLGFGLNYGMKENKLARSLGCTKKEAKDLIELYLDRLPGVRKYYDEAISDTEALGFSYTLLGRRRFHPEILSHNQMEKWGAERQAMNNGIQGTAADAVKLAMILCDEARLDEKYGTEMELQIHDELVFEAPEETVREVQPIIQQLMEHPFPTELAVPLTVSIGNGPNWMDAK